MQTRQAAWPSFAGLDLKPTTDTLQLWSQVVGKIRLMTTPWENHSWHVPLYLGASGFGTGLMLAGSRAISLQFDLLEQRLRLHTSEGVNDAIPLQAESVASFYKATMAMLGRAGIELELRPLPCEIADSVAFHEDHAARAYDAELAQRYWRAMLQVQRVFQRFRTRFIGKCSPIHLFWGSFDLAVTRFSGRPAPLHPGGAPHTPNSVMQEAYQQEVSSAGFWPGGGGAPTPCFYSYAWPAPAGFAEAPLARPGYFDSTLGEFLLPYEAVAASPDPDQVLLDFLQQSYEAAAMLAHWDRAVLERAEGPIGTPPPGPWQ
ncbi:MAG: DUF5996 family protein [Massilia sp.]